MRPKLLLTLCFPFCTAALAATQPGLPGGPLPDEIAAVSPESDAEGVPVDTDIKVVFKTGIDPELLDAELAMIDLKRLVGGMPTRVKAKRNHEGELTYDSASKSLVFQPDRWLVPGRDYYATVFVAIDILRGQYVRYSWRFRAADVTHPPREGVMHCADCRGQGQIKCTACKGNGRCPNCDGTGYDKKGIRCTRGAPGNQCPTCKGSAWETCPRCSGYGILSQRGCSIQRWVCNTKDPNASIAYAEGTPGTDSFGAIAYSKEAGRFGYTYEYSSAQDAENAAIRDCGSSDCKTLLSFRNRCAAAAVGSEGRIGIGVASAHIEAGRMALMECSK